MATALEPSTRAEVVSIALSLIDRDPKQPRFAENVDTDLAPSFKAHGWFESEPLEIRPHPEDPDRFMLVDGERRLAGARAAGLKEALCILTLEAEGESEGARLMRQIMHNASKPLTPVEKALAFKRIIDDRRAAGDKSYGAVQLSREIGIAKSTITDHLAATEIPDFWLPFIVKGPLQTSHIPILHRWRKLPEKYQRRGLERLQQDHRWKGGGWDGRRGRQGPNDRIHVGDFAHMLDEYFKSFTKPVSEVPGYKGPTERMRDPRGYRDRQAVIAMDPAQWQPIARKRALERRKKNAGKNSGGTDTSWQARQRQWAEDNRRRREAEERRELQWKRARGKISAGLVDGINAAKLPELQEFILQRLRGRFRHGPKSTSLAIAAGNTGDQFVRHLALLLMYDVIDDRYQRDRDAAKLAKRFKVDVAALLKAAAKDPDDETPAAAAAGSGDVGAGPEGDDESDES